MSPDEREFGILIGKVEAIGEQIAEMRRSNSAEHAQVVTKLDEVRAEVATKATRERVKAVEVDVDDLKRTRDEGRGMGFAIKFGQGVLVLGLMVAGFFMGGGSAG